MKDIRRTHNLIMNLSKFIFNKKILNKIITLGYNYFYNFILFFGVLVMILSLLTVLG